MAQQPAPSQSLPATEPISSTGNSSNSSGAIAAAAASGASGSSASVHDVDVAIMGGGLAGCLLAIFLARDGYSVNVYERRADFRRGVYVGGRSINLALSARGLAALAEAGLDEEVRGTGIPMYGRRLHSLTGSTTFTPYGQSDQYNLSVVRQTLNDRLLNAVEKHSNVRLFFEHKCLRVDLENGTADVQTARPGAQPFKVKAKLIVGADGAFSMVRNSMTRVLGFNYSQQYLDHEYKELCIPPTKDGDFALPDHNSLHIWPRDQFMMIALPNQDRSYTCTIFMPGENFAALQTDAQVMDFMRHNFPDAVPLMPTLLEDWRKNPTSKLVTVTCGRVHHPGRAVLIGDAAHALVPFFGQGMNASFQDAQVLAALIRRERGDFAKAIEAFTREHKPDMDAVQQLSHDNYMVMRHLVNSRRFLLRRRLEIWLNWLFPTRFVPLYSLVSFTTTPYHKVVQRAKAQDRLLDNILTLIGLSALGAAATAGLCFVQPKFLRCVVGSVKKKL